MGVIQYITLETWNQDYTVLHCLLQCCSQSDSFPSKFQILLVLRLGVASPFATLHPVTGLALGSLEESFHSPLSPQMSSFLVNVLAKLAPICKDLWIH
jgi:hypothetical protein